jgi:hypothetical protein
MNPLRPRSRSLFVPSRPYWNWKAEDNKIKVEVKVGFKII